MHGKIVILQQEGNKKGKEPWSNISIIKSHKNKAKGNVEEIEGWQRMCINRRRESGMV